jgi:hypothetical protein
MATTQTDLDIHSENFITCLVQLATLFFAGAAMLTIANLATGRRFAFLIEVQKVRTDRGGYKKSPTGPWNVMVRTAEGWADLCQIVQNGAELTFRLPARRCPKAMPWRGEEMSAFRYLFGLVTQARVIPPTIRIWASESCCRCGANLVSEYRHLGLGPECIKVTGLKAKDIKAIMATRTDNQRVVLFREALYSGAFANPALAYMQRLCPEGLARDYLNQHAALRASTAA